MKKGGTFFEQAHPYDDLKPWSATKKMKAKTEPPLFPLPDESTETEALAMSEVEVTAPFFENRP
ncbi:MAG: hypothetical protein ACLQBD_27505 [Syntrophobacteraceae bacterium]